MGDDERPVMTDQRSDDWLHDIQNEPAHLARPVEPDVVRQPRNVTPIERPSLLEHSPEINELLKALVAATLNFDEIDKDLTADVHSKRTGTNYKFDYASLKEINSKVRKPLAKEGLILMHGGRPGGNSMTVRTTLWHISGQWVRNDLQVGLGGATDPQAIGTAISYAKRYNILAILNLSPGDEEDDDGRMLAEAAAAQPANGPKPGQRKSQQPATVEPAKASTVQRLAEARTKTPIGKIEKLAAKDDGVTYVVLESGYLACTKNPTLAKALASMKEQGQVIRLEAEGKPGYAPTIVEIAKV